MLVFPEMIAHHAERAGIKVPPSEQLHEEKWDKEKYIHWTVFCNWQLCRAINWDEPEHNAKLIAAISEEEIKTMKFEDFIKIGLRCKT